MQHKARQTRKLSLERLPCKPKVSNGRKRNKARKNAKGQK